MRFKLEIHIEQFADIERLIVVADKHRLGATFIFIVGFVGICLPACVYWLIKT